MIHLRHHALMRGLRRPNLRFLNNCTSLYVKQRIKESNPGLVGWSHFGRHDLPAERANSRHRTHNLRITSAALCQIELCWPMPLEGFEPSPPVGCAF